MKYITKFTKNSYNLNSIPINEKGWRRFTILEASFFRPSVQPEP